MGPNFLLGSATEILALTEGGEGIVKQGPRLCFVCVENDKINFGGFYSDRNDNACTTPASSLLLVTVMLCC